MYTHTVWWDISLILKSIGSRDTLALCDCDQASEIVRKCMSLCLTLCVCVWLNVLQALSNKFHTEKKWGIFQPRGQSTKSYIEDFRVFAFQNRLCLYVCVCVCGDDAAFDCTIVRVYWLLYRFSIRYRFRWKVYDVYVWVIFDEIINSFWSDCLAMFVFIWLCVCLCVSLFSSNILMTFAYFSFCMYLQAYKVNGYFYLVLYPLKFHFNTHRCRLPSRNNQLNCCTIHIHAWRTLYMYKQTRASTHKRNTCIRTNEHKYKRSTKHKLKTEEYRIVRSNTQRRLKGFFHQIALHVHQTIHVLCHFIYHVSTD